jgi:ribosome-binding factor A
MRKRPQVAASVHKTAARVLQAEFPGQYVTVTQADVSPDTSVATVWVSVLPEAPQEGSPETMEAEALLAQAQSLEGKIRRTLADDLQRRRVPEVTLQLDTSARHAQAIEDTLRETRGGEADN